MEITNKSLMAYFVLQGFPGGPTLHITLFVLLLLVYLATLAGNFLIIIIICTDLRLHSPMYFFLTNMSILETCGISAISPKLLSILIAENKTIFVTGCHVQTFVYFFITSSVFLLLAVMSFDRFLAICHPLRYTVIMQPRVCVLLVCICQIISAACILFLIILISKLPFCDRVLNHFFCDATAMLKLVCADITFFKLTSFIISFFILFVPLMITVISYIFIVYTVMKIPTKKGRKKTFSTCVAHMSIVSIVFGSAILIQIRPTQGYSVERDKAINLGSTVLAPLVNPFIYTLRNDQVKKSIRDAT
uniref:G-protein coupled receptors family 1 profile domain-containing protein n=1 Tax=Pyxicephalus adspersus TaxID=30357 RepID=A0AAV3AHH7_PYXAD|nr:TPA: hypothetical protein GDO54_013607 [Pyxicephalus adspersus]